MLQYKRINYKNWEAIQIRKLWTKTTDSLKLIIQYKSYIELIKQLEIFLNYNNFIYNRVQAPEISEDYIYNDLDPGGILCLGSSAGGDDLSVIIRAIPK